MTPEHYTEVQRKGVIGILSVGAGDFTLSFDKNNPRERERAAKVVSDMLKRGYAILVQVGVQEGEPIYRRAKAFDAETCEYIIVGDPPEEEHAKVEGSETVAQAAPTVEVPNKRGRPRKQTRIPAEGTRGIAVARTAGG